MRLVEAHRAGDHLTGDLVGWQMRESQTLIAEAARRGVKEPAVRFVYLAPALPLASEQAGRLNSAERPPRAAVAGRAGYRSPHSYANAIMADLREVALDGPAWPGGLYFDLRDAAFAPGGDLGRAASAADPPVCSPPWTVERRDAGLAEMRAWLRGDRAPFEARRP